MQPTRLPQPRSALAAARLALLNAARPALRHQRTDLRALALVVGLLPSPARYTLTQAVLASGGVAADVADAVAPALHPAEVWALWLYARSAGLGCAWIAAQIYDRQRRQPRMAGKCASAQALPDDDRQI